MGVIVIANPDLSGRGNLIPLCHCENPHFFCHCEERSKPVPAKAGIHLSVIARSEATRQSQPCQPRRTGVSPVYNHGGHSSFVSLPLSLSFPHPFMSFPRRRESIILRDELNEFKDPQDLLQLPELTNLEWEEWIQRGIKIIVE